MNHLRGRLAHFNLLRTVHDKDSQYKDKRLQSHLRSFRW